MLRGIQNATRNWLGRLITGIVLGMIAISFAVWGIGDIFKGFGTSRLAKVGGTEIGVEQFRQQYNDRLQQLIRQLGRPISADQARSLGLHRSLLGQLLAEAAIDEEVRRLGLNMPNDVIAQRIRNDPVFRGITGQFDRTRFDAVIRQAGFTEARYVAEQKKVLLRQQLIKSLTGDLAAPAAAVEIQDRYSNEQRALDYFVLGPDQAGEIGDPSPEALAKFFEDRKALFRAPEFRKVDLIILSPEELAKSIEISDEDLEKAYQADRAKYVTPEKREVHQIVFPNEADAREAAEKLKQPDMTFEQFAAAPDRKGSDINLGLVGKAQMLDPAIADAAFSLASGQVSEPVKGRFGTALVKVGKIVPEVVRSQAETADEIKRNLALERARREIRTQYDKIEDERGAGASVADIAKKVGVPVRSLDMIDRSGRGPDGNPMPGVPNVPALLNGIFNTEIGAENDPVQLPGSAGYVWFEAMGSTPSRERPLDEVRDRVIERWRTDQVAVRLREKAKEAVDKLKTATISEVATELGAKPQFIAGLKRDRTQGDFPSDALETVFSTAKDQVGSAEGGSSQWIVFRVTGVTEPKVDMASADAKRIQATLVNAYSEDILAQFIARLQTDLGATINEAALAQVIGGANN
ncbi:MAG: SurA N-terminal domain-containing protein [Pseudorhodoplanes sp.]